MMRRLDNKGFTLLEVLAVVVIVSLLVSFVVPNVISSINTSKTSSQKILVNNIKVASQQLFEEVEFNGNVSGERIESELLNYKSNGGNDGKIFITVSSSGNYIGNLNLQALINNGFLKGTGNGDTQSNVNAVTGEDIGDCKIKITKIISDDYDVSYKIDRVSTERKCPSY